VIVLGNKIMMNNNYLAHYIYGACTKIDERLPQIGCY